jgi:carbon starvation protein CstA
MGVIQSGKATNDDSPINMVSIISKDFLGEYGGYIAIAGVIILAITSGDTALRSLRITVSNAFKIKQDKVKNRLLVSTVIFAVVCGLLVWSRFNYETGFLLLWRYFA